jgi:pyridoxamine 5'-phosphate oxidase
VVSDQSKVIESHAALEEEMKKLENQQIDIKRPAHWGGFVVKPVSIEFWQGRPNRLHDRLRYTLSEDGLDWKIERLAP